MDLEGFMPSQAAACLAKNTRWWSWKTRGCHQGSNVALQQQQQQHVMYALQIYEGQWTKQQNGISSPLCSHSCCDSLRRTKSGMSACTCTASISTSAVALTSSCSDIKKHPCQLGQQNPRRYVDAVLLLNSVKSTSLSAPCIFLYYRAIYKHSRLEVVGLLLLIDTRNLVSVSWL